MNRHFFSLILMTAFFTAVFSSCNKDDSIDVSTQITMTTEASEVSFRIGGTGKMLIDWEDGTPLDEYMLSPADYNLQTPIYAHEYSKISSRTITIFSENITTFSSTNNQLTSFDVGKNIALINLACTNEYQLTSFDVSKNTALQSLFVQGTQLTSLDVSKNIALKILQCFQNYHLEILDVSNNIALGTLMCNGSQLTELDVSKNTTLTYLSCYSNKLTELDVKYNKALTHILCLNNQLTNLDVSENTALILLVCDNNQFDDISLNALFGTLHSKDIPYYGNPKTIYIGGNPGTDTCDPSIAESKGWKVEKKLFNTPL